MKDFMSYLRGIAFALILAGIWSILLNVVWWKCFILIYFTAWLIRVLAYVLKQDNEHV